MPSGRPGGRFLSIAGGFPITPRPNATPGGDGRRGSFASDRRRSAIGTRKRSINGVPTPKAVDPLNLPRGSTRRAKRIAPPSVRDAETPANRCPFVGRKSDGRQSPIRFVRHSIDRRPAGAGFATSQPISQRQRRNAARNESNEPSPRTDQPNTNHAPITRYAVTTQPIQPRPNPIEPTATAGGPRVVRSIIEGGVGQATDSEEG